VTPTTTPGLLDAIYPTTRIRGRLIRRDNEQTIRWANLDAATAGDMGREQIGWFVGGHPGLARATEQLGRLDSNPQGGVWVIVPLGRELSCELFATWPFAEHVAARPGSSNSVWRSRKVWVAIPEDLKQLLPLVRTIEGGVAGVIVLDPPCILYKTRGGTDSWGNVHPNDRPQHVVNFRAGLDRDGWQPPLLLLTEKPAKAVDGQIVARAFCLNTFRFVAGDSFGCWEVPITEDE